MTFLRLPLANLAGRPFRTALTASGVALAVASFIALVGFSRGLEGAWTRSLQERGTHVLAVTKGSVEILTGSLEESLAEELSRIPGVQDVSGELIDLVTLADDTPVLVVGWPAGSVLWESVRLVGGRLPDPSLPREVLLGSQLAEGLDLTTGGSLDLWDELYEVTGIFEQGNVMSDTTIVMGLPPLQALMERPGKVTVFNLRLDQPDDAEATRRIRARLDEAFPGLTFTATDRVTRDNQVLGLLRAIAWSTSTIALLMGAFFILNTLLMSVGERTREVGVLTAVGWSGRRIVALILLEGLVLALAGGILGAILGVAGLEWLARLPHIRGFIDPQISTRFLLEVVAAALLLGALGGLYPAWRALRLTTVKALRYE